MYAFVAIKGGPVLYPESVYVRENDSITLTCLTSPESKEYISWRLNGHTVSVKPTYTDNNCVVLEGSFQSSVTLSCSENNSYSITFTNRTRSNNGDTLSCIERSVYVYFSNIVTLHILGKQNLFVIKQ